MFIDRVHYNPEQASRILQLLEGITNGVRYRSNQKINNLIIKKFLKIEGRIKFKIRYSIKILHI